MTQISFCTLRNNCNCKVIDWMYIVTCQAFWSDSSLWQLYLGKSVTPCHVYCCIQNILIDIVPGDRTVIKKVWSKCLAYDKYSLTFLITVLSQGTMSIKMFCIQSLIFLNTTNCHRLESDQNAWHVTMYIQSMTLQLQLFLKVQKLIKTPCL